MISREACQLKMEEDPLPTEHRVSTGSKRTANFKEVDASESDRSISSLRSKSCACFEIDGIQDDV